MKKIAVSPIIDIPLSNNEKVVHISPIHYSEKKQQTLDKNSPIASKKMVNFWAKILGIPFSEIVNAAQNLTSQMCMNNLDRIRSKVDAINFERGIGNEIISIPFRYAIPLVQKASYEDDDIIQNLWARLIANVTDPSLKLKIKKIYIYVLSSIEPLDSALLSLLWRGCSDPRRFSFQQSISPKLLANLCNIPVQETCLSLINLHRLGCVELVPEENSSTKSQKFASPSKIECRLSSLGESFVSLCKCSERHS